MLTPENSKLLAIKKQIAVYNKDYDMIKKIEKIKNDNQISEEIKKYKQNNE